MSDATVSELWRYPVKSMMGEALGTTELTDHGIPGDRGWAARDEKRGGIRGAKKIGGLMRLAARYDTEPVPGEGVPPATITLLDGTVVRSDAPEANAAVSDAVDHPVTLWPLRPADDLDHYRRGAPDRDDLGEELRQVFAREPDEPLPDLSSLPPEILEFESPPGTYFDAYPLLILTDASLRRLAELAPDSVVDVRRFRPNVVLSTGDEGFVEQDWLGRRLHLGDAVVRVVAPCPRCVMITRSFADLPQDRGLMRTVVREADQNLGVYATVERPGRASLGDPSSVEAAAPDR